jgi:hypothetical protein
LCLLFLESWKDIRGCELIGFFWTFKVLYLWVQLSSLGFPIENGIWFECSHFSRSFRCDTVSVTAILYSSTSSKYLWFISVLVIPPLTCNFTPHVTIIWVILFVPLTLLWLWSVFWRLRGYTLRLFKFRWCGCFSPKVIMNNLTFNMQPKVVRVFIISNDILWWASN